MKSFKQFFLEYHHNLGDGTKNIHTPLVGKNGNGPGKGSNPMIDPLSRKNPEIVGPYKKDNDKLDRPGAILTFPELEEMGLKDLMDIQLPTRFDNIKNSGASVQVFMNNQNQIVGRVLRASRPDK